MKRPGLLWLVLALVGLPDWCLAGPSPPAVDAVIDGVPRLCEEATSIEFAPDETPKRFSWFCASDVVPETITCYDYEPAPVTVYVVDPSVLHIRCLSPDGAGLIRDGFEDS